MKEIIIVYGRDLNSPDCIVVLKGYYRDWDFTFLSAMYRNEKDRINTIARKYLGKILHSKGQSIICGMSTLFKVVVCPTNILKYKLEKGFIRVEYAQYEYRDMAQKKMVATIRPDQIILLEQMIYEITGYKGHLSIVK